jgi:phosphoglycerate dehydrogenase-like enzyme
MHRWRIGGIRGGAALWLEYQRSLAAMEKWKVSCLAPWDEEIKQIVLKVAPPNLEVRFAASYEPDVQYVLAVEADFIMTNFAPVLAKMIEDAPRLRMIHKWGVGYEKIDTARGGADLAHPVCAS